MLLSNFKSLFNRALSFFFFFRLQILHCLNHVGTGGENLFVDGFKALEILKTDSADIFNRLATTPIDAEYLEPGYHFFFNGPIIKINPVTNQIEQIR